MNTAKRVAGILIFLAHFIGGLGAARVIVILFFARQSELTPDPYAYNVGPQRDPMTPIWFFAIAGLLAIVIGGSMLYVLGRKFPRVSIYAVLLLPALYVLPFIFSIAVPGMPDPDAVTGFVKDLAALTYYSVIGSWFGVALISAASVDDRPVKVSTKPVRRRREKDAEHEQRTARDSVF